MGSDCSCYWHVSMAFLNAVIGWWFEWSAVIVWHCIVHMPNAGSLKSDFTVLSCSSVLCFRTQWAITLLDFGESRSFPVGEGEVGVANSNQILLWDSDTQCMSIRLCIFEHVRMIPNLFECSTVPVILLKLCPPPIRIDKRIIECCEHLQIRHSVLWSIKL